jgi:crotonobetainyl-CoA:carnitine CoA-transferase CaiB-like acyl-CoA transferase
VALNLARAEDRELVPALTGGSVAPGAEWEAVAAFARVASATEFRDRAVLMHLPTAVLGEAPPQALAPPAAIAVPRRVIDLSALWAGPLCAGLLARAGAEVVRIESAGRPDPTRKGSPVLDQLLNGGKQAVALDLRVAADRDRLLALIAGADALVTNARPAALARLGLTPAALLDANPALIWAAITAHGWHWPQAERVGFGDDCAVAGGLVGGPADAPQFLGDALADPLTGVEAALAICGAQDGGLIDLAMARIAAGYADRAGGAITGG